jgi:hypothetical protein
VRPVTPAPDTEPSGSGWSAYQPPIPADAALGQRTQNEHYVGQRLLYDKEPEGSFDPIGNPRLIRQFALHALLYFMVCSACALLAFVVLLVFGFIAGFAIAGTLWVIGAVIFGVLRPTLYGHRNRCKRRSLLPAPGGAWQRPGRSPCRLGVWPTSHVTAWQ